MKQFVAYGITIVGIAAMANAAESVSVVEHPPINERNAFYVSNRPPLQPQPLIKLPIGAIEPEGWLEEFLDRMSDGFTGQLMEISRFLQTDNNAWLAADGEGDHPWEELPYWLKGYGDLAYVLGEEEMIATAKMWIAGTLSSQRDDGWFGPRPNLTRIDGKPDMWPNMIMLDCLESYYEFTGDKRVLELMTNYFRWQMTVPDEDFLVGFWQRHRAADNLNSVYWLYNRTGEEFLLELADKLHRNTANWTEEVANWHGVNISQAFRGPATYWVKSHDDKHLKATDARYEEVMEKYGQVPGGMFGADEVAREGYTGPRQAAETCTMVEYMLSFEELVKYTGDLKWADRCEEVAFNDLPAALTADFKALRYLGAPNHPVSDSKEKAPGILNGGPMYLMNGHIHRCCQHNSGHGWPYYAEHLWMATPDNGLAAVLYAESEVTAKVADGVEVTVETTTKYPFDDRISFELDTPQPVAFPLYLRVPEWAAGATVAINGEAHRVQNAAQRFIKIERTWREDDTVTLTLPMALNVERYETNGDCVSVSYGPLTYSLAIEHEYKRVGGTDEFPAVEIHPASPWNYGLELDADEPTRGIEVVKQPGPLAAQPFTPDTAPIELRVKARRIPEWTLDENNLAHEVQPSPARTQEPLETVKLIPMGAARIRVSAFPTVSTKWNAYEWQKPPKPQPANASHVFSGDTTAALSDGRIPESSGDTTIPRFTWWDHTGSEEWVQYEFDVPTEVSEVSVYWFDDRPTGGCRIPTAWRLLYKDGGAWKPVRNASAYGIERDQFNTVTFEPVQTKVLRLMVELQEGYSAGILEWQVPGMLASAQAGGEYPIKPVPFTEINVADEFWRPRLETARDVTLPYTFQRCEDTGRIANLARAGGLEEGGFIGLRYNDSDVFKVMEGAAYALALRDDPELDQYLDELITKVAAAQEDDGYLLTIRTLEPDDPPDRIGDERWSYVAHSHELYNVGHLYEAAAAHYQATGKRTLLDVALKSAELIAKEFGPDARHDPPGHQEIEIGLVRLYRLTGDERFLDLAHFFLEQRGRTNGDRELYGEYSQDHAPVTQQAKPVGHAVRAMYMYCGMADVAALTGNQDYIQAIDRIWQHMVSRSVYITGGVGARHGGESFGDDYELPNASAYAETCAAIGNALWNHRMFLLHGDARYADVLERVLYNGFLSGVSFEGDTFFYVNPLMAHSGHQRQPWFGTACCPTNVARFLPSLPGYIYGVKDGAVYVNLFVAGEGSFQVGETTVRMTQQTRYPWDGSVRMIVAPARPTEMTINVRIPGWVRGTPVPSDLYRYEDASPAEVQLTVNGDPITLELEKGYVPITRMWKAGDTIDLALAMPVRRVRAHPEVADGRGRVAFERGPVVYAFEGVDNGGLVRNIMVPDDASVRARFDDDLLHGVTVLEMSGYHIRKSDGNYEKKQRELTAVPYYAWNHREPGEMAVWVAREPAAAYDVPVLSKASDATIKASHVNPSDTTAALNDGLIPESSHDASMPRFTWWPRQGTEEWVAYEFASPTRVSEAEIYWFDDRPGGGCRIPAAYELLYQSGDEWKPAQTQVASPPKLDEPSVVKFAPVETTALRLSVKLQDDHSGGIIEWRVN